MNREMMLDCLDRAVSQLNSYSIGEPGEYKILSYNFNLQPYSVDAVVSMNDGKFHAVVNGTDEDGTFVPNFTYLTDDMIRSIQAIKLPEKPFIYHQGDIVELFGMTCEVVCNYGDCGDVKDENDRVLRVGSWDKVKIITPNPKYPR